MDEALFDKASGYYIKKDPIGKNADFITAPEISQVFGELLAAYILQASLSLEGEMGFVEMGAGRGTLFYDILFTINKLAKKQSPAALDFLAKTTFNIIEINEALTKIQKEKLSEFKINWYQNFAEFLEKQKNRKIFFLANELFDCFAIDQYVKTDIGWCERMVGKKDQKLQFVTNSFDPQIHDFVENLIGVEKSLTAPFGAVFEYSATAANFIKQLSKALQINGGMAVIVDYGYIRSEFANSLQAIKNHKKTSVLDDVKESDITALFDFSLLEKIAQSYKLHSSLISQAEFLLALGIEQRKEILLTNKNQQEQDQINSAIGRLINKDQMGELFKCLIIWK
jgi:NADH dehydrogenase [ubiquinone] 1 alpha subcomplex assembly factor 7